MNNGYQPKYGILDKLPIGGSNAVKSKDEKFANIVWKKRITGSNDSVKVICRNCKKENIIKTNKVTISKIPYCSNCDRRLDSIYKNYCPYCGSKLKDKQR